MPHFTGHVPEALFLSPVRVRSPLPQNLHPTTLALEGMSYLYHPLPHSRVAIAEIDDEVRRILGKVPNSDAVQSHPLINIWVVWDKLSQVCCMSSGLKVFKNPLSGLLA